MPNRSFIASSYRYGFNGKEKDDEVNVNGGEYDFGARMYDSRLGRWWSIDPLYKKYAGYCPYNFVLNSPILYKDIDGRDLDVGGDTKRATADLRSIVPAQYQSLIMVSDAGKVSFDASQVCPEDVNDAGIKLVSDLVGSSKKYLYEVKPNNNGKPLRNNNGTTENNSENPKFTHSKTGDALPEGYNGEVIVHPDAEFESTASGEENRSSIVFHELSENYERTNNKKPYTYKATGDENSPPEKKGAHETAIDKANGKNSGQGLNPDAKAKGKEGQLKNAKVKPPTK